MPQAKFSLSQADIEFLSQHEALGFADKSALVRRALEQMREHLAKQRLKESARLYAEIYAEDQELRDLTNAALGDWPE